MSDIAPRTVSAALAPTLHRAGPRVADARPVNGSTAVRGDDRVEFSRAAQLLSKLHELPDVRQDLVDRVKNEIASGTYETPDKLDAALESLSEDLA
jgi:negative regulator of flagellin synthesis FlgM